MDRKVPNDACVMLEESEVDAYGVNVIELPKLTAVDQLFYLPYRSCVNKGVVDHKNAAGRIGLLDHSGRLFDRSREGLLDQHVLPGTQGPKSQVGMGGDRRRDGDGVDLVVVEDVFDTGDDPGPRMTGSRKVAFVSPLITNSNERSGIDLRKIASEIRPPVPIADDGHPKRADTTPPLASGCIVGRPQPPPWGRTGRASAGAVGHRMYHCQSNWLELV